MTLRFSALLVWILAGAAAVFWGMRLLVPATPLPDRTQVATGGPTLRGDLTRLLGAPPVAPAPTVAVAPDAATRFRLTGVVATRNTRDPSGPPAPGLALISVDGKPPQAYRVGDALDPQYTLASVGLRSARVTAGGGGAGFVLDLPPPTPPATGVPPSFGGAPPMPVPPVPPGTPGQGMPAGVVPPGMFTPPSVAPAGGTEGEGRPRLETQ